MTAIEAIQNFGTLAIIGLAVSLFWLATGPFVTFNRYGREAMYCVGSYLMTTAVLRVLVLYEFMTPAEVRVSSGLVAFGAFMILFQITVLQRVENRRVGSL